MTIYICPICSIQFSRTGRRKAVCCSLACRYKYISKIQTGKPILAKRMGEYRTCKICGKEKYVSPSKYSASGRFYCSIVCRNSDKSFWDSVTGKNNHRWKGGRIILAGYVYIRDRNHPFRNSGDYIAEHRLVMEKKLGRFLTKNEEVHHVNGIKTDNRIENLELVIKKIHFGKIICPHCQIQFKVK